MTTQAVLPLLIWTRPAADWPRDSHYLSGIKNVLRLPCLTVSDLENPLRGISDDVLVVTSPRGAEHLEKELPARARGWPSVVHAFGPETSRRLSQIFSRSAANAPQLRQHREIRTAAELAPLLVAETDSRSRIAILGPETPAYDLAGFLNSHGRHAQHVICYRTLGVATDANGAALSETSATALAHTWRGAICFASPSAVSGFLTVFRPPLTGLRTHLVACAIGPSTAKALEPHFDRLKLSPENELASLVNTAQESLVAYFPEMTERLI